MLKNLTRRHFLSVAALAALTLAACSSKTPKGTVTLTEGETTPLVAYEGEDNLMFLGYVKLNDGSWQVQTADGTIDFDDADHDVRIICAGPKGDDVLYAYTWTHPTDRATESEIAPDDALYDLGEAALEDGALVTLVDGVTYVVIPDYASY